MGLPKRRHIDEPEENGRGKFAAWTWIFWLVPVLLILLVTAAWAISGSSSIHLKPTSYVQMPLLAAAMTPSVPAIASPSHTPTVTSLVPSPLPSTIPVFPTPTGARELVRAHLSFYWPPYGQINCDYECEHIATGDDWEKWVGKGLACPSEYPLGTTFIVMGKEWKCVDRGNAIIKNTDGSIWLDLLLQQMPDDLAWGSIRTVEVRRNP